MKKISYLILFLLVPLLSDAQTLFRSGRFLHHSTGGNIWGPNGSSTSIPQQIAIYNTAHDYTGSNAVAMIEQPFPATPWTNEWERWHRIFDNQDPDANILPILAANKIVVIKSCFPSSEMTGMGQPSDTLTYTIKSMYNYKWHWRHIVNVMAQHPENFFVIWTNAPHIAGNTNPAAASLSKSFCAWAKNTLAQGLDPEIGAFPPNIYVFDYFSKLTDANGYELPQYAVSTSDSHPNGAATELVAPQFVNEIFNAAIIYEQVGSTLNVSPPSRNVPATAGTVGFTVTSNRNWHAQSNAGWCTVTQSGSGNGTITANYSANTVTTPRTATITVSATGVSNQVVTVVQAGISNKILNISALLQGLYAGGGIMNQSQNGNGPNFAPGVADLITIELHNASNYSIIEYTSVDVALSTNGSATISIPLTFSGNYYITINHRNSIETTSANPVSFAGPDITYNFNQQASAYGGNLLQMSDGWFAIYGGDVNQDGMVDISDFTNIENLSNSFAIGYLSEDVNGDGSVDTADGTLLDNNQSVFVGMAHP